MFFDLVEEVIPASYQTTLVLIVHQVQLVRVPHLTDLRIDNRIIIKKDYKPEHHLDNKNNTAKYLEGLSLTCLRNSSKAISPWATRRTSFTTISFFCRSTSQICPRVSSDGTQFTCKRFISCFQWRSFRASDFSSITNMLTWLEKGRGQELNNLFWVFLWSFVLSRKN